MSKKTRNQPRDWQPAQALSRPAGHDSVVNRLLALSRAPSPGQQINIAHAYLFSGPLGVGKFKTALWWAARLKCRADGGCDHRDDDPQSQACEDCRKVAAATHPDLNILSPAEAGKDIGIDEARWLIAAMALKPVHAGPRLAIIRDAHALTVHAQSALLKLIEEPPGFAVIILVSENPAALLPTVRSRCQAVRLGLLDEPTIAGLLVRHGYDQEHAQAAAAAASGSVGRALALSDEALADRQRLLTDFESFRSSGSSPDLATFVDDLSERNRSNRHGLATLLEWQLKKIEAALGYAKYENCDKLTSILSAASPHETTALLEEAGRIHSTMGALSSRANVKIAIRDLLLDIRQR